jgi:hypothetical protein
MRFRLTMVLGLAPLITWLLVSVAAETRDADWPLHNLDLKNSRFSPLDQINASNVGTLANAWSFEVARSEYVAPETPLVIDGVMYFNSGTRLFAVNAVTGKAVWTVEAQPPPSLMGKDTARHSRNQRCRAVSQGRCHVGDTNALALLARKTNSSALVSQLEEPAAAGRRMAAAASMRVRARCSTPWTPGQGNLSSRSGRKASSR